MNEKLANNSPELRDSVELEKARQDFLDRAIDVETLTSVERAEINQHFPSGNFLFHSTTVEGAIKIIEDGNLRNGKSIDKIDPSSSHNSGWEGVSWNFNGVEAMPGDDGRLVGFVMPPEKLEADQQLVIPSRPAPYELLQLSKEIEPKEFFKCKNQLELYRKTGFPAPNSVIGNILDLKINRDSNEDKVKLLELKEKILQNPDYPNELKQHYDIEQEKIVFGLELLQQKDDEIPLAGVWIQAALDQNRFKDTIFENCHNVVDVIDELATDEKCDQLIKLTVEDWRAYEEQFDQMEQKQVGEIINPIEDMYFVAPQDEQEIDHWAKTFQAAGHWPAKILLYDSSEISKSNFTSDELGDHQKMTNFLRKVVDPNNSEYIDYEAVLGRSLDDAKRAGWRDQVLAQSETEDARRIIKKDGQIVVE